MLLLENTARRFQSEKVEQLFDLKAEAARPTNHYSSRQNFVLEFHSLHRLINNGNTIRSAIFSPLHGDLRFELTRDSLGYFFKMTVGELTNETLQLIDESLIGLRTRLKAKKASKKAKLTGFSTDHLKGIYLWGINPGTEELEWYQEAVDLGEMSEDFKQLCIKHNVSVKKLPEE